ncbi:MAG: hypothetical protein HUU16_09600, partial [Candidatus Omnitrophica bacterium]|nr:hypothetical protein [Candidatus Omnitrophota bacterium]
LSELDVRNEPLFESEPALLTVSAEAFQGSGESDDRPRGLRYGWVDSEGKTFGAEVPISASGSAPLALGASALVPPGIRTVTAALEFPRGEQDSLSADDERIVVPKTLKGARLQVLAADPEWRHLLQAALSAFEVEGGDPSGPPPSEGGLEATAVLLIGEKAVSPEWTRLLRARVEGGEGLLVLIEGAPVGAQPQAWSDWWNAWECVSREVRAPAGAISLIAGAQPWFDSALDSAARAADWAEQGFRAFPLAGWSDEWLARSDFGEELPLFQTRRFGAGTVVAWTVPLSPSETGLVLSPGWVPLLSQMVKRTLIDPNALTNREAAGGIPIRESDLRSLSEAERELLAERGVHSMDADEFIGEIENLPSTLHDWTAAILALCFLLALVEIGVSNSV